VDLDGALGDTRPLWRDFLADAARRFAAIAPLDPESVPDDRAAAAEELDRWAAAGIGDWRAALARFAEDRAPVYLRPRAETSASPARPFRSSPRAGSPPAASRRSARRTAPCVSRSSSASSRPAMLARTTTAIASASPSGSSASDCSSSESQSVAIEAAAYRTL